MGLIPTDPDKATAFEVQRSKLPLKKIKSIIINPTEEKKHQKKKKKRKIMRCVSFRHTVCRFDTFACAI